MNLQPFQLDMTGVETVEQFIKRICDHVEANGGFNEPAGWFFLLSLEGHKQGLL